MVLEFDGKLIGTFRANFEHKFSRGGSMVVQLEEVIVDKEYRGKGIGQFLMNKAIEIARKNSAYRIIGDCKEELLPFYEFCGFKKQGVQFGLYLE